jgi:membrane-bound lytic murein transglycosylase F
MKKISIHIASICLLFLFCLACSNEKGGAFSLQPLESMVREMADSVFFPLKKPTCVVRAPLHAGKLRALTLHSINSYFVYDGQEHGLEYELLMLYAKKRNLQVEIVTIDSYKQLYDSISKGNFDIILGTLLKNSGMDTIIPFSEELYKSDILLVSAISKRDLSKLDDPYHVIHFSPAYFWSNEDSVNISSIQNYHKIPYDLNKELALEKVASQEYPTIVMDRHEFRIMHAYFPQLKEIAVLQKDHPIAFAFNPHSKDLSHDFNAWLVPHKQSSDYAWTLKKYDDFALHIGNKLKYEQPKIWNGQISQYDPIIKEYAAQYNFDWKLLAALINQESKFNRGLISPVGAKGLMQVMPSTAKEYKVSPHRLLGSEDNIQVGTKYFHWLYQQFEKEALLDADNKLKFALAAYNGGIGHISDARALAVKHHLNPNVWDDNVELMLTKKSHHRYYKDKVVKHGHCRGWETSIYVKNILLYYQHYQNFLPERTEVPS